MNKLDEITLKHKDYFNDIQKQALEYYEEYKNIANKKNSMPHYLCERFNSTSFESGVTFGTPQNSVMIEYEKQDPFSKVILSSSTLSIKGITFLPEAITLKKEINNKSILYYLYDDASIEISIDLISNKNFKALIVISEEYKPSIRYPNKLNKDNIFNNEERELINQLNSIKELLLTDKITTLDFLLGNKKLSLEEKETFKLINDCDIGIIEELIYEKPILEKNNIKKGVIK